MKIAVCVKQTPDTTTRVKIAEGGTSVVEDDIQWVINPYDESAIEAALQLTEQHGGEVTILTLGPERAEKTIREALAMGADKAVRLHTDRVPDDPLVTTKALAAALADGGYDLIFTGQQAVDDDQAQIPSRLAQALDLPCVTGVEELEIADGRGTAVRAVEGAREKLSFSLPAVVGTNRRLNDPRYPSFKNIMQAKKKAIEVIDAGLAAPMLEITGLALPPEKSAGRLFDTGAAAAPEVVRLLRDEAKVL